MKFSDTFEDRDTVEEAMESILKLKSSKMSRDYAMDETLVCMSMEDLEYENEVDEF